MRVLCAAMLALPLLAQLPNPAQVAEQSQQAEQSARGESSRAGVPSPAALIQRSVPQGERQPGVLALSLRDAVNRALKANLGTISGDLSVALARAESLRAVNALRPNVSGRATVTSQQINLRAFGFPLPPGTPSTVGPFETYDARAFLTYQAFSLQALRERRAAQRSEEAARFTFRDVREQVILVVVNQYLQAITAAGRVTATEAELSTASALLQLARDQKQQGLVAGIDVLRAQVQQQNTQQRLIQARADGEQTKLALAQAIGLPSGQEFRLTDPIPTTLPPEVTLEEALQRAQEGRFDLRAAQQAEQAAELQLSAARAERLPTVNIDANYGTIGRALNEQHGTYSAAAGVRIPIYQGTRVRAEIASAETALRQRRAERESLRGQIDTEVRSALLDIRAARERLEYARSNVQLAAETLVQARDRFAAGVANNIEVIQAQQAVVAADDALLNAQYSYVLARAVLVRATGGAEQAVDIVLGGK